MNEKTSSAINHQVPLNIIGQNNAGTSKDVLKGLVERISFRSDDGSFVVLKVRADDSGTECTLVGRPHTPLTAGTQISAQGSWVSHPRFGKQFRASLISEVQPTTREGILKYLSSGVVKGLGPVLASRIVETFGEKTIEILDSAPDRLREVPGIGARKVSDIRSSWDEKRNAREVILFFQSHNLSLNLAQRIFRVFRERSIDTVKNNPYLLTREVWGIGFQTADKIAQALMIERNAAIRLEAGLFYTLRRASDDGHTYLPKELLITRALSLLELPQDDETELRNALLHLINTGELIAAIDKIYFPYLEWAERELAENIVLRLKAHPEPLLSEQLIEDYSARSYPLADHAESGQEIKVIRLSPEQQQILSLSANHALTVITGGPGCGKTTGLRALVSLFRKAGLSVKLTAPTGRAAQKLAEVCAMEASTIHRLLKFDPTTRSFVHSRKELLICDVVVIDESSMIDLPLAAALFEALPLNCRIVVVGDADQLPSVGPGRFLADLLSIHTLPRVSLTTLFRRAAESSINHTAHQVNAGVFPDIPTPDGETKSDVYFLQANEPQEAAELVERLVCDQLPKKFAFKSAEIMVLTPMNKGELGVVALNERLQARLRPKKDNEPVVRVGNIEFRFGDRVCQRVNNYQITAQGVFNGDQGEIIGIDPQQQILSVRLWDNRIVDYSSEFLYQLDLAYALTIHRAQGSEAPAVVLVLHDAHSIILERQLLYTGITRAKRLLVIVGTRRALAIGSKKTKASRRFTDLSGRCQELLLGKQ